MTPVLTILFLVTPTVCAAIPFYMTVGLRRASVPELNGLLLSRPEQSVAEDGLSAETCPKECRVGLLFLSLYRKGTHTEIEPKGLGLSHHQGINLQW